MLFPTEKLTTEQVKWRRGTNTLTSPTVLPFQAPWFVSYVAKLLTFFSSFFDMEKPFLVCTFLGAAWGQGRSAVWDWRTGCKCWDSVPRRVTAGSTHLLCETGEHASMRRCFQQHSVAVNGCVTAIFVPCLFLETHHCQVSC